MQNKGLTIGLDTNLQNRVVKDEFDDRMKNNSKSDSHCFE